MSSLILRCGRRGVASVRLLPSAFTSSSRHYSNGSVPLFSEKPRDNMHKFMIGSFCVVTATLTKIYLDFLTKPPPDIVAAFHHDEDKGKEHQVAEVNDQTEKPQPEISGAEKMFQDHLKVMEEKYEEQLKAAQSKAEESEARALSLQKELENESVKHKAELKAQADAIVAKLEGEIETLKNEINASEEGQKEKFRLVQEITQIKGEIESLGITGSDLEVLRKLATVMGVFSYESAMMNGEPLEKQVAFLQGGDALIDAAISSLPEDAVKVGSLTPLELQSRFVDSKSKLRELVLVPASGGGAVSHLIAKGASTLKVNEENSENSSDDGNLESVFDQVEILIKQSNLAEAGKVLEQAVQGTEAEALAAEWAAQARLRASVEQVHSVLRAHAASISMSPA